MLNPQDKMDLWIIVGAFVYFQWNFRHLDTNTRRIDWVVSTLERIEQRLTEIEAKLAQ